MVFEGVCLKCKTRYYGWALQFQRNQSCPKCGTALEIYRDGKHVSRGYSPFEAEKYSFPLDKERKDYTPEKK